MAATEEKKCASKCMLYVHWHQQKCFSISQLFWKLNQNGHWALKILSVQWNMHTSSFSLDFSFTWE